MSVNQENEQIVNSLVREFKKLYKEAQYMVIRKKHSEIVHIVIKQKSQYENLGVTLSTNRRTETDIQDKIN